MAQRDEIEAALSRTMKSQISLKQIELRCRQGVMRYGADDLLGPAQEACQETLAEIQAVHRTLQDLWRAGESRKWIDS
jgi:hypothetical protein